MSASTDVDPEWELPVSQPKRKQLLDWLFDEDQEPPKFSQWFQKPPFDENSTDFRHLIECKYPQTDLAFYDHFLTQHVDLVGTNVSQAAEGPASSETSKIWTIKPPEQTQPESPSICSSVSFGDSGITATVNAYGQLVQITRYLGVGQSGFFSVDHQKTPEPWAITRRLSALLEARNVPRGGIGLWLDLPHGLRPELEFVYSRWPRFTAEIDGLEIVLQYVISGGTVIQEYTLIRSRKERACALPRSRMNVEEFLIRDLDWQSTNDFNDESQTSAAYHTVPGLYNRALVLVHEFPPDDLADEDDSASSIAEVGGVERTKKASERSSHYNANDTPPTRPKLSPADAESRMFRAETEEEIRISSDEASQPNGKGPSARPPEAVGVIMAMYINGNAWEIDGNGWKNMHGNGPDSVESVLEFSLKETGTARITMAYRPQLMHKTENGWGCAVIPAPEADIATVLAKTWVQNLEISTDSRLDFVLRRNLEHVLSVCAVPIPDGPVWDHGYGHEKEMSISTAKGPTRKRDKLWNLLSPKGSFLDASSQNQDRAGATQHVVALTCGDLSGHHVVTSASFFAFKFLLAISEHIRSKYGTQAEELQRRIYDVCAGHLSWTFEKTVFPEPDDTGEGLEAQTPDRFRSNYWVSGRPVAYSVNSRRPRSRTLMNTPFQFLKAIEFSRVFSTYLNERGIDPDDYAHLLLKDHVKPWVSALRRDNRWTHFAFKRSIEEGVAVYRLEDHVWIWEALKGLEGVGLSDELIPDLYLGQVEEETSIRFSSASAQTNILRRFSTDNPISGRRMLATTRSARESRFLFHARDTSLFYAMSHDFFNADSRLPLWKDTVEAQRYHDHNNSEEDWDNPLRYGLALIMASKSQRLNSLRRARDIFRNATEVLFRSCFPSGIFAGELDDTTKKPVTLSDVRYRDFYWHVGFEIPFLFLLYGRERLEHPEQVPQDSPLESKDDWKSDLFAPKASGPQQMFIIMQPGEGWPLQQGNPSSEIRGLGDIPRFLTDPRLSAGALRMKKTMPFNNVIDQKSIVELADEWLYSYPEFLDFDPELRPIQRHVDALEKAFPRSDSMLAAAVRDRDRYDQSWPLGDLFSKVAGVIDVPRSKHTRRGKTQYQTASLHLKFMRNFLADIDGRRTAQDAKKRLIWMPLANKESAALLCYLSTPGSQREPLSDFFDRHMNWEKYFFEDTVGFRNIWETEFHLSFYQLFSPKDQQRASGFDPMDFPQIGRKRIGRAAMGFRFVGDFFDRYWTCHVVEIHPAKSLDDHISPISSKSLPETSQDHWKQRKVLELVLFDRMLDEITTSTKEILDETRKELGIQDGTLTFGIPGSREYWSSSSNWQRFHHILQEVEEDLGAILEEVQNWNNREAARGQQQPRWTKEDERKYRHTINKVLGHNERQIRKLRSYLASIQAWKSSLERTQESFRNDVNLLGAEKVRIFTVVTVVFLPLSFAASIFSMNGAPEKPVWIQMAVTAAVALVVTCLMILGADSTARLYERTIGAAIEAVACDIEQWRKTRSKSIIHRSVLARTMIPKQALATPPKPRETGHTAWLLAYFGARLRLAWFWVAYVAFEYPGIQINETYYALRSIRPDHRPKRGASVTIKRDSADPFAYGVSREPGRNLPGYNIAQEDPERQIQIIVYEKSHRRSSLYRVLKGCKLGIRFVWATLLLPIFLFSSLVRFLFFNISDIIYLIQHRERRTLPLSDPSDKGLKNSKDEFSEVNPSEVRPAQTTLQSILKIPTRGRPFAQNQRRENEIMQQQNISDVPLDQGRRIQDYIEPIEMLENANIESWAK